MLCRSIFRGVMEGLRFCHNNGIAHGSLGSGSVLMSTFDDYQAERLRVKLDNFGFANRIAGHSTSHFNNRTWGLGKGAEERRREDIQAVGVLFLETTILALREEEDTETAGFLERLALEIYKDDFDGLKYVTYITGSDCRHGS